MYYNGHDGLPYSWVFGGDVNGDAVATDVDLAYIPKEDDSIVTYKAGTTAEQIAAFKHLIDSDPYLSKHRGEVALRNHSQQPWINQLDLGIQQELPGFFDDNKFVVRMDIYNFLNLPQQRLGRPDGRGLLRHASPGEHLRRHQRQVRVRPGHSDHPVVDELHRARQLGQPGARHFPLAGPADDQVRVLIHGDREDSLNRGRRAIAGPFFCRRGR
jgi:hypothetical protein